MTSDNLPVKPDVVNTFPFNSACPGTFSENLRIATESAFVSSCGCAS